MEEKAGEGEVGWGWGWGWWLVGGGWVGGWLVALGTGRVGSGGGAIILHFLFLSFFSSGYMARNGPEGWIYDSYERGLDLTFLKVYLSPIISPCGFHSPRLCREALTRSWPFRSFFAPKGLD